MGSHLRIDEETFAFERATFVAYHCASSVADWNLELIRAGEAFWLSGKIVPAPRSPEDLDGARVEIDLRSLDDLADALLGRAITMFPGGQSVCALSFTLARSPTGVRFASDFSFEWDHDLETFPIKGTTLQASIELDAEVGALHPGGLPRVSTTDS